MADQLTKPAGTASDRLPLAWLDAATFPNLDMARIREVGAQLAELTPRAIPGRSAAQPAVKARARSLVPKLNPNSVFASNSHTDDLAVGSDIAEIAAQLNLDTDSVLVALVYRPVRANRLPMDAAAALVGEPAAELLAAVLRLATASLLETRNAPMQTSEARDQVANVRAMLVAMINDVRVAVLKLAERVVALRRAKTASVDRQQHIARESELVFAPLASRLGIRQLKWELEDLSLRYLDADAYHNIARQLDGRRSEREARVAQLAADIQNQLAAAGVDAQVQGRAKNIYSIWRKMRSKAVSLAEVYDVSAVRILVDDVAQCYATLGLVHAKFAHIPTEFDDYIAAPKENGYRSIHTAVQDAQGLTLEIQIRTRAMHHEAELGICAHWAYKTNDAQSATDTAPYAQKMDWMRQVLEQHEALGGQQDLTQLLHQQVSDTRLFVHTPAGHVVDMASASTPLDFAYRVHTNVGNSARAARVDGQLVPLNFELSSGQHVEIITDEHASHPLRRWLEPHLGFAVTARAQEKIRDALRTQPAADLRQQGERLVLQLLQRHWGPNSSTQLTPGLANRIARSLGYDSSPDLWLAVGQGQVSALAVLAELVEQEEQQLPLLPELETSAHSARVQVIAINRDGLLRDVAMLLSRHDVGILASSARADVSSEVSSEESSNATKGNTMPPGAVIELDVSESGAVLLAKVLDLLAEVPGVTETYRIL